MLMLVTILLYFCALLILSRLTARRSSNDTFFRGNRQSPWYMVAFGMVGASISGVSFVSVPGMAISMDMTYLQMCMGFILGYFAVAFVLLPIYYRMRLTTIYSYLRIRLGTRSYKTGASFFLLSKMVGATVRFYVVCIILQRFVLDEVGIPFPVRLWHGGINMVLYTQGRNQDFGVDGYLPDFLHVFVFGSHLHGSDTTIGTLVAKSHTGHHGRQPQPSMGI